MVSGNTKPMRVNILELLIPLISMLHYPRLSTADKLIDLRHKAVKMPKKQTISTLCSVKTTHIKPNILYIIKK